LRDRGAAGGQLQAAELGLAGRLQPDSRHATAPERCWSALSLRLRSGVAQKGRETALFGMGKGMAIARWQLLSLPLCPRKPLIYLGLRGLPRAFTHEYTRNGMARYVSVQYPVLSSGRSEADTEPATSANLRLIACPIAKPLISHGFPFRGAPRPRDPPRPRRCGHPEWTYASIASVCAFGTEISEAGTAGLGQTASGWGKIPGNFNRPIHVMRTERVENGPNSSATREY
jgi:hypothetical protein